MHPVVHCLYLRHTLPKPKFFPLQIPQRGLISSVEGRPLKASLQVIHYRSTINLTLKLGNKKASVLDGLRRKQDIAGRGGEIRTLGEFPHVGFQDRCIKPLCHPSKCYDLRTEKTTNRLQMQVKVLSFSGCFKRTRDLSLIKGLHPLFLAIFDSFYIRSSSFAHCCSQSVFRNAIPVATIELHVN